MNDIRIGWATAGPIGVLDALLHRYENFPIPASWRQKVCDLYDEFVRGER